MIENDIIINYLNTIKDNGEVYIQFKNIHNRISVNIALLYELLIKSGEVDKDNYLKNILIKELKTDINNILSLKIS